MKSARGAGRSKPARGRGIPVRYSLKVRSMSALGSSIGASPEIRLNTYGFLAPSGSGPLPIVGRTRVTGSTWKSLSRCLELWNDAGVAQRGLAGAGLRVEEDEWVPEDQGDEVADLSLPTEEAASILKRTRDRIGSDVRPRDNGWA